MSTEAKKDEEEIDEEQAALNELATIKLNPAMLEELNRIVDDATLEGKSSIEEEQLEEPPNGALMKKDSNASFSEANLKVQLGDISADYASTASSSVVGESAGLQAIDASVDEALVGCIEMDVSDDGSLEPASVTVDRKGDLIVRNVNSMLDKKRRWIVNGRNLGKVIPPPVESGMSQHEWQDCRVSRFLEDLNAHRLKIAALYITGIKFSPYNSERIGRCVWEDTGIKREGKFKYLIDVDTAFLRYSDFITDSLYKVVSPAVSGYCALKRIVLTQCRLGLNGTRTAIEACFNNIFIEELVVSGNNCTDAVMPDIVKTLKGSANRFRILGLGSNAFTAAAMEGLADALKEHAYLRSLHLSGNPIGDEGASYLFRALRDNMVCETLNLSNCELAHCPFAAELRIMGKLAELNLSQNRISDRGVADIADALEGCVCLRHLDLSNNHFSGKRAVKIGEMLEHNKGLLSLSLSSNQAIYQVWNSIAVGLMKNCTLMRLDLTLCDINLQAAERIHEALGINNVCDINLDLNPLPDVLRLNPRGYIRPGHGGGALSIAANAPGQALSVGQQWRTERLQQILTSKNAISTVARLQDPSNREPLGWDRNTLGHPVEEQGSNSTTANDLNLEDEEARSIRQKSIHGEPSLFSGSLSIAASLDGTAAAASALSPDKSLLDSLIPGSKQASPEKRDTKAKVAAAAKDGDDAESVMGESFADNSSMRSADLISLGGKEARKMANLKDKLNKNATNDNQGRLILSVCYGRASESLGTIEVDIHTTYPEAKELIRPMVKEYLAAIGNLRMADHLIEGFQVLDPDRKVVEGEKATVRSVWTEASVNDHTLYVRPANWIGMVGDEEEEAKREEYIKRQGKYQAEDFKAFEYNDEDFHGEADDDMSAISDEGMFESSTLSGSYQSQRHYFAGEGKKKTAKEEKWI